MSFSVSTVCSISSFVLCLLHGTYIICLHIYISSASSRQIASFCFVFIQHNTKQCCLMNRKVKSFKQCFYWNNRMFCSIKSYNKYSKSCLLACHRQKTILELFLPLVYCHVDDTLFEVSPEIHCSGVSTRYCCYGNHTAGSKPI